LKLVLTSSTVEKVRSLLAHAGLRNVAAIPILPMGLGQNPANAQLIQAYQAHGINVNPKTSFHATPQDCQKFDFHPAMPGVPDYTIDILMHLAMAELTNSFTAEEREQIKATGETGLEELREEFGDASQAVVSGLAATATRA
jgi:hypothetical protein